MKIELKKVYTWVVLDIALKGGCSITDEVIKKAVRVPILHTLNDETYLSNYKNGIPGAVNAEDVIGTVSNIRWGELGILIADVVFTRDIGLPDLEYKLSVSTSPLYCGYEFGSQRGITNIHVFYIKNL